MVLPSAPISLQPVQMIFQADEVTLKHCNDTWQVVCVDFLIRNMAKLMNNTATLMRKTVSFIGSMMLLIERIVVFIE
jgi:hypothetical protein